MYYQSQPFDHLLNYFLRIKFLDWKKKCFFFLTLWSLVQNQRDLKYNIATKIGPRYEYVKYTLGIQKYWQISWFRYETFITFLTFRFSTWGERDTQFLLCWLFHLNQQPVTHLVDPNWPGLAWPNSENQLAPSKFKSQLTDPTNARTSCSKQLDWPCPDSNPNLLCPVSNLN